MQPAVAPNPANECALLGRHELLKATGCPGCRFIGVQGGYGGPDLRLFNCPFCDSTLGVEEDK